MNKMIMSWSQCTVKLGKTGEAGAMSLSLFDVGKIKDKSTSLEASEGEKLEAKSTGGNLEAMEELEGGYLCKFRVMEQSDTLLTNLGLGSSVGDGDFAVKTHIVSGYYSLEVTPKNVGAIGISAPYCHVTYAPGRSEDEGEFADITVYILKGDADYWYKRFKKKDKLKVTPETLHFANTLDSSGKKVTATCTASSVVAKSSESWCTAKAAEKVVTVTVSANETGSPRVANVTITADGKVAVVEVTQDAAAA